MSLAFLSPRPSAQTPARSPLLDPALAGGARSQVRDGWEAVASFGEPAAELAACRETVGFADLSHLAKAELNGPSTWLELSQMGLAAPHGDGWLCPLTPRRGLLLGATGAPPDGASVDLTSSLGAISVAGPGARETIARFCAIDTRAAVLPPLGFRPGSIARTPGYLLREGRERFLLIFGAAYGQYLWEAVADAAARLGGRPVGIDALPAIAEEVNADA